LAQPADEAIDVVLVDGVAGKGSAVTEQSRGDADAEAALRRGERQRRRVELHLEDAPADQLGLHEGRDGEIRDVLVPIE